MQIECIELSARDLCRLEMFYGSQLGLGTNRTGGTLTFAVGKTELIFREDDNLQGAYHFAFNIPENRIDAAKQWLDELGIDLIPNGDKPIHDFQDWRAHSVYFRDSAGNILELIARHELDNAFETSEPFSAKELLNVSETGIACEDVLLTAGKMLAHYGLEPYRSPSDQFAPIGDAYGLFILVPTGRIWYPNTGIPAEMLPLNIRFSVGGVPFVFPTQADESQRQSSGHFSAQT